MTPAEPPEPSPESQESSEEYALFLDYRARRRAQRERRRQRRLRIAAGAFVAGAGLLTAVLFWTRHERPPVTAKTIEPPAVLSRDSATSPAVRSDPSAARKEMAGATTEAPGGRGSAPSSPPPQSSTRTPAPAPTPPTTGVMYQPRGRLSTIRVGDAKEAVFERFGTAIERRNGSLVRIEGMRLRATGRSPNHAQVEVAEVRVGDTAAGSLYWFLFGDGRLVAWGRPEEWAAATGRYQVEIDYQPNRSPTRPRTADHS
jgi:hypothetical protein